MSLALARKELRELRPWAILGLLFGALDLLTEVFKRKPDQRPLGITFDSLLSSDIILSLILAFAIGTTLVTREEDEGTLGFLDGLPVSRSRVFFVKLGVATGVLLVFPTLQFCIAVGLHFLSRGSLDQSFHGVLLLELLGIHVLLVFTGLSFGAMLGRLRSLTWLVAGCLAVGLGLLTKEVPRAAILDPTSLSEVQARGLRLTLDGQLLAVQLGLAVSWMLIAWAGFVRSGRRWIPDLAKRPVISALITLLTVGTITGAMIVSFEKDPKKSSSKKDSSEPQFTESAPASTTTAHYRISYPALEAKEALAFADEADAVFEKVHTLLGVPLGDRIDVDLSGSLRTTAGTAFLGGVRMKLGSDARRVLAHETSHVVSRRVAGEERAFLWNKANVLNEGLASWVERRFAPLEELRRENRFTLAALHNRGELSIEELVNPELLARNRDDSLKYRAGEALIDATVKVYGVEALPKLLAAFADEKLPPDLNGLELWQACFQVAGMDLGRVFDAFFREVEADSEKFEDELSELPQPRAVLLSADGWYGAKAVPDVPLPKGWALSIRFRPGRDSPFSEYDTFNVAVDQPAWREARRIRNGQLCVQAGVKLPEGNVIYEPWECLPVDEAIPWNPKQKQEPVEATDSEEDLEDEKLE